MSAFVRAATAPLKALSSGRTSAVYLAIGIACLASFLMAGALLSLPPELGSDWSWYAVGPARMMEGQPLYDPAMLSGPFDYLAFGPTWNMAPWALPFVMIPWGHLLWWALMSVTLLVALALIWPRARFPIGWLLAAAVGLSVPFIMGMTWGNLQSVSVLGVALWFVGRRRGWWWLEAIGITLAFVKIIPAIPLVLWSLDRPKVLVGAAAFTALLTVPAVLYGGVGVIADFVVMQANIIPLDTAKNLSPMKEFPIWIVRGAAIALILFGVRRSPIVAFIGVCLLVPNLYGDWFLLPLAAALVEAGRGSAANSIRSTGPAPVEPLLAIR